MILKVCVNLLTLCLKIPAHFMIPETLKHKLAKRQKLSVYKVWGGEVGGA